MQGTQKRLFEDNGKIKYSYGPYNKSDDEEQRIRITEGCPHQCDYCYEPKKIKVFNIPEIVRNKVSIIDMNLLCKKEALDIIEKLGTFKVNNKVVYYELICGIDFRFLTQEIADELKKSRFRKIRIAWDWGLKDQYEIKKTIRKLMKAGYKRTNLMVFMICNWKIPFKINLRKLDLCKVWNVKVSDCYYDNQTFPNVIPILWNDIENNSFRKKVRKHNQIVRFGIDPELNRENLFNRCG